MPENTALPTPIVRIILIATPAIVITLLALPQGAFAQLMPVWTDEILYWHQARSFVEAGLSSGYYTVMEVPAEFEFVRFYTWGTVIPMIYALGGVLFQWQLNFIPLYNLLLLTLSLAIYVRATRPTLLQSIIGIVLVGTYSPLLLYGTSSLNLILQLALAAGIAAGFSALVTQRGETHTLTKITLAALLVLACFVRLWWAALLIPYVILITDQRKLVFRFGALLIAGAGALIVAWLARNTGSPFPYWFTNIFETSGMPTSIRENFWQNRMRFTEGDPAEILLRLEVFALFGASVIGILVQLIRERLRTLPYTLLLTAFFSGVMIVAVYLLYDAYAWRDFRIFGAALFMLLLLLLASKHYWLLIPIIAANIIALPHTAATSQDWTSQHINPQLRNAYYAWEAELQKELQYDPAQDDDWCNTVLYTLPFAFDSISPLLAVDAGIGLSTPLFLEIESVDFKSRYLLLDEGFVAQWGDQMQLEPIMPVTIGTLYRNLAADCDGNAS